VTATINSFDKIGAIIALLNFVFMSLILEAFLFLREDIISEISSCVVGSKKKELLMLVGEFKLLILHAPLSRTGMDLAILVPILAKYSFNKLENLKPHIWLLISIELLRQFNTD